MQVEKIDIGLIINEYLNKFPEPVKLALRKILDHFLIPLYAHMTEKLKGIFEPLEALNLFFELLMVTLENKFKPAAIREHLDSLHLNIQQRYFLLDALCFALNEGIKEYPELSFSKIFVETELEELKKEIKKSVGNKKDQQEIELEIFPKTKKEIKNKKPTETLFDIWNEDKKGGKGHYEKAIEYLQKEYREVAAPFVIKTGEKLFWNEIITGNRQYLAAFIYQMTTKKWISKWYKAPEYKQILESTFIFEKGFNPEPFKGLSKFPPEEKYLKAFFNFPSNL